VSVDLALAKRGDRGSRKRAILALFADRVAAKGYDQTSIGELADELGISKGTIVHHFGSKDRLLELMSSEYMDRRLAEIRRIAELDDDPAEQLRQVIQSTLKAHEDDRAATVAFSREFTRFMTEPVMAEVRAKRSEFMSTLKAMVARGVSDGSFRSVDPSLIGLQLMSMCNWSWTWLRPGGRLPVQKVADEFAEVLLRGVRA
jgi:AcrR family transcriptional regulator